MSTKLNPGNFDCYAKLKDDEPYFVLRASDPHAPAIVELWASLRESEFGFSEKFAEARVCADAMRIWFKKNGGIPLRLRNLPGVR